ncbi:MAG: Uncharacterised protein [Cyanobium sp. ARS6]|nr:MAG: Uncharacterised protein [Cyanobium sp. ARS6]
MEMSEIVLRKGHARHVGINREASQTDFVFLWIAGAPWHRINWACCGHHTAKNAADQRLQHKSHLGSHSENVSGRGCARIRTHQLVQVGRAASPMPDHDDRVLGQFESAQSPAPQQGLKPCERLQCQSTQAELQSAQQPARRRPGHGQSRHQGKRSDTSTGNLPIDATPHRSLKRD